MPKSIKFSELSNPADQNARIEELVKGHFNSEMEKRIAVQLKEKHDIYKGKPQPKRIKFLKVWSGIAGIAASLLVLFFFLGTGQNQSVQKNPILVAALGEKIVHPGLSKGAVTSEVKRVQAVNQFNAHDFMNAYQSFERLESPTTEDRFYKAMCLFYQHEYLPAYLELEMLSEPESTFYEEVQWFMAMSTLKLQNYQSAKQRLSQIKEGEWNYEKSQALLSHMNE